MRADKRYDSLPDMCPCCGADKGCFIEMCGDYYGCDVCGHDVEFDGKNQKGEA